MAALWGDRTIRILVDNYHDSGGRQQRLGYPASAELTVCRERLTWGLLKRYHVAVIEASAPAQVAVTELRAVERFVSEGGGLLIAGSAPQYEFATGAGSPMDMPAAHFAEIFGFEFPGADSARAETTITSDLTIGYRDEDVEAVAGAIPEFGPHAPGLQPCAPLTIPEGARPLLVHAQTGEPLAAIYDHGAGRVCVCAGPLDHINLLAHLDPIVTWLAGEAEHRPGGRLRPEIGPLPSERTIRGLRLICDRAVEGRAEEVAALVCRLEGFLSDLLGRHWERPQLLELRRSCHRQRSWEGGLYIGAAGSDAALTYNTILVLVQSALWNSHADDMLTGLFPEPTVMQAIAFLCLEHLGYADEARRLRERALEAAERADRTHTEADLARVYWATQQWRPKGHWLLTELQRRFGDGFLARLFEVLPKERKDDKLPQSYTTAGDRVAYYLSLAAGEDLTPFLREVGTSVRALPLVPPDDPGFDDAMRAALAASLAVPETGAATRMDALSDLARLKDEERAKLPEPVRELTEAFMRSGASDQRAIRPLERLARGKDAEAAAWAALQLVSMGRAQWADRLEELLPERDPRFRLMGGHVLQRTGRERPEHTLQGLAKHGPQVAELRSVTRDLVAIHPMVGGYEVANVLGEAGLASFPYDHLATQFYVY